MHTIHLKRFNMGVAVALTVILVVFTLPLTALAEVTAPVIPDTSLSSLSVSGYSISPEFSKDVTKYYVDIPTGTSSISVTAKASDSTATVTKSKTSGFYYGINVVTVTVTDQSGEYSTTYRLYVNRKDQLISTELSKDSTLKSITVDEDGLSPEFSKDVYQYELEVDTEVSKVITTATASHSKATVSVSGGERIPYGYSHIIILVTSQDKAHQTQYVITVYRPHPEGYKGYVTEYEAQLKAYEAQLKLEQEMNEYYNQKISELTEAFQQFIDEQNNTKTTYWRTVSFISFGVIGAIIIGYFVYSLFFSKGSAQKPRYKKQDS
ncbi:MAG: cadherin-like beta sandwich domain-containing protein [Clostridiales bacterium]|nr:cadherin-like beta sandwich domain-containing protein [Clostridiales bacterium]